jgi:hypothetical protein
MFKKLKYLYKNFIPLSLQFFLVFLRNYEFYKLPDIFIHIPRNGGIFISQLINRKMGHLPISYISRLTDCRSKYFYCVIRHPVDRFISSANYLSSQGTRISPSYSNYKIENKRDLNFLAKNINTMYRLNLVLYPQVFFIQNELELKIIPISFNSFKKLFNFQIHDKFKNGSNEKFIIKDLDSNSIKCLTKFYMSDISLFKNLKGDEELFIAGIEKINKAMNHYGHK